MEARVKVESASRRRSKNRNGKARPKAAASLLATAVKGKVAAWLVKLMLKRSVLIAVGLGTLASWYVKHRFFRPVKKNFLGF
jgi:hypothetical protein